jgi:hypothetical protein
LAERDTVDVTPRKPALRTRVLAWGLVFAFFGGIVRGDSEVVVELRTPKAVHRGRVVAHNKSQCVLVDETGRMTEIPLAEVTSFRKLEEPFRPLSLAAMRDVLAREFGKAYEVRAAGRYLVVAAPGRAKAYAEVLDGVYRSFFRYFSVRGFSIPEPKFPLVAVVFADRKSFMDNCRQDGVPGTLGLAGYYLTTNNRVALFDRKGTFGTSLNASGNATPVAASKAALRRAWHARVQGDLYHTLVHEATHQIAYNTGLHSRVGWDPDWVVEGLATVFEADGIRDRIKARGSNAMQRINRERFVYFKQLVAGRRRPQRLAAFLSSDAMYRAAPLDAYAQGWALTFFLIETRPQQYARYLKKVAARESLQDYTAEERLADFQSVFGKDVERLDAEFLRYFDRLE